MGIPQTTAGLLGYARIDSVQIGARAALDDLGALMREAEASIRGEIFAMADGPTAESIRRAARHGTDIRLHADPELFHQGHYRAVLAPGVLSEFTLQGDIPAKLHSKAAVADGGTLAWLSTAAPFGYLRRHGTVDASVRLSGDAAAVLDRAIEAAASHDTSRVATTARDAAARGVLINDALHGVYHLTRAVDDLLAGAAERLYIGAKHLKDPAIADAAIAARARGVDVLVETSHRSPPREIRRLRHAGVPAQILPKTPARLHLNAVLVDDVMYLGTAAMTARALGRPRAFRPSRELGVLTRDTAAIDQVLDGIAHVKGSRLGAWGPRG